jgi:hypothetical protein
MSISGPVILSEAKDLLFLVGLKADPSLNAQDDKLASSCDNLSQEYVIRRRHRGW